MFTSVKKPETKPATPPAVNGGPSKPPTDLPTAPGNQIPLQSLKDFRFPTENLNTAAGDLTNTVTDTTTNLAALDEGSTKTKASKRDKAKKLQKRIALKIRSIGSRIKKRAAKGKKKLKPKTPALKLKVEMDNPTDAAKNLGVPAPA